MKLHDDHKIIYKHTFCWKLSHAYENDVHLVLTIFQLCFQNMSLIKRLRSMNETLDTKINAFY